MKTSSAKAKGRNLQKYVVSRILSYFPELKNDDITSRSMGAPGEDLLFSPAARGLLGISIECKSHAKYAVYKDYAQAKDNAGVNEPVLVIKQNQDKPLAIVDLDYFIYLHRNQLTKSNK